MPNIASVLKEEMARASRKEIRSETEQLRKSSAKYRSEIAALKKRVMNLERALAKLTKHLDHPAQVEVPPFTKQIRFSASGLKNLREKRGLSASVLATVLGVTPQTVYSWEAGNTRPGAEYLEKIAEIRQLGKRQLAEILSRMHPQ